MPTDLERIGLETVCLTQSFSVGMNLYVSGLNKMEVATEQTAARTAQASQAAAKTQESALSGVAVAAEDSAGRQGKAAGEAAAKTDDSAKKQEAALTKVGLAFTAAGAAAEAVLISFAMTAARGDELAVVLDVTTDNAARLARQQGDLDKASTLTADAVGKEVDAVKALHLPTETATNLVAQLIRANQDYSKATDLARLAQDAAIFSGENSAEALEGILHGILTLQPEVLRYHGVMVNLEGEYKSFAEANDRTVESLSSAEKQTIALNAALAQGPAISGAYEAAMGTASKQLRSLDTDLKVLAESFGKSLTPTMGDAVGTLRDLIQWLTELPAPLQATIVQAGGAGAALLTLGGAAMTIVPKINSAVKALQELALVQSVSAAGLLGPLGLVAALTAAAGVALTYAHNVDEAHKTEAAAVVTATNTYPAYIRELDAANLSAYALTEQLWELVKAQEAQNQAELAKQAREAQTAMEAQLNALLPLVQIYGTDSPEAIERSISAIEGIMGGLSDLELVTLTSRDLLYDQMILFGMDAEQADYFSRRISESAHAQRNANAITQEYNDFERERVGVLTDSMQAQFQAAAATDKSADSTGNFMDAVEGSVDAVADLARMLLMAEGEITAFAQATKEYADQSAEAVEKAADRMVDADQQAADRREQAAANLSEQQVSLEQSHADRVEDILEDIAQVDVDLQQDRLEATEQFEADRAAITADHQQDLLELERDFQQDRADLEADYRKEIEDAERDLAESREETTERLYEDLEELNEEYAESLIELQEDLDDDLEDLAEDHAETLSDLQTDLNRDLEKLAKDHQARMTDLETAYQEDLLGIAEDYAQRRQGIEADYAAEAEAIKAKYADTGPSIDEQREALEEERDYWEDRKNLGDWGAQGYIDEIDRQLEELMQLELDALEERKQAELAELEKQQAEEEAARQAQYDQELADEQAAYEDQRSQRQTQYDEALADEQEAYDKQRAERQAQYDEQLADEQAAYDKQRAERQADYEEDLADLQAQHDKTLDELARAHQEQLAEQERAHADALAESQAAYAKELAALDEKHAEELAKLDEQAAETKARLGDQLAEENANYAERQAALVTHYNAQIGQIGTDLAREKDAIADGMAAELTEIVDDLGKQSQAFKDAYSTQLTDLQNHNRDMLTEQQNYINQLNALFGIQSPSRVMMDMGRHVGEGFVLGMKKSMGPDALSGLVGDVQSSLGSLTMPTVSPASALPLPAMNNSTTRNETYNNTISLTANYRRNQSEASLRDDVAMIGLLMGR